MEIATIVLEYVKVMLSAPALLLLGATVFIYKFADDIRRLMAHVAMIRLPGGAEIATQQSRTSLGDDEPKSQPDSDETAVEVVLSDLLPAKKQAIQCLIQSHSTTARIWEYRYLNYFLVRRTQLVLDWIVGLPEPTTSSHYDSLFLPIVPLARERNAIIGALESHHLITVDGAGTIRVTPKGLEYQQWRGALPPPPHPSPGSA